MAKKREPAPPELLAALFAQVEREGIARGYELPLPRPRPPRPRNQRSHRSHALTSFASWSSPSSA